MLSYPKWNCYITVEYRASTGQFSSLACRNLSQLLVNRATHEPPNKQGYWQAIGYFIKTNGKELLLKTAPIQVIEYRGQAGSLPKAFTPIVQCLCNWKIPFRRPIEKGKHANHYR